MKRLEALSLLERGKITLDEAKRELSKPERPPITHPVFRLLVRVESRERRFTLWLPWAPLALLAGVALPIGWGPVKRQMPAESAQIGLCRVLALLFQVSAVGGGLSVEARSADGEYVKVAM